MELNTVADVNALTELQKLEQIQSIDKRINDLKNVPLFASIGFIVLIFIAMWFEYELSNTAVLMVAIVMVVSHSRNQNKQMDLLKQWCELKYGK
jgi:hypothetical protein